MVKKKKNETKRQSHSTLEREKGWNKGVAWTAKYVHLHKTENKMFYSYRGKDV